jgi:TonB family protein
MNPFLKAPLSSAGSLSLRPEGEGADVRLIFRDQPTGGTRVFSGTLVHVAAALLLLFIARLVPDKVYDAVFPQRLPEKLVWLAQAGPSGGGGGGNRSPNPPPPAQLKGPEEITIPAVTPPEPQPVEPEKIVEPPRELLTLPAQTMAAANQVSLGDIGTAGPSSSNSRGPGDGPGVGPGKGPGLGPGSGGSTGGGPLQVGNGVLPPRIRRKVDPQYSADAMRAKIQGSVLLSVVVLPDGSVTDIRVLRSLDRSFGLDTKAIEAARQWQFFPGTRQGEPVPVLVNIELEFNLR